MTPRTFKSPCENMSTAATSPQPQLSTPQPQYSITPVSTPEDLVAITTLFTAYAQSLNIDLTFQDFAGELASLPGKYAASQDGALLVARHTPTHEAVGCIALRRLSPSSSPGWKTGELKRLYVRPSTRGSGLGRRLAERVVAEARALAYDDLRLDTLSSMTPAQRMYESLGFVDVEPYCFNPIEGTRFLGLTLRTGADTGAGAC